MYCITAEINRIGYALTIGDKYPESIFQNKALRWVSGTKAKKAYAGLADK